MTYANYGQGRGNDDVFLSTGTRLELRLANLKADQIEFRSKKYTFSFKMCSNLLVSMV